MGRRKRGEEPQMRFHAHSGQARVRINGEVIYLGPWDSPEAKANYRRLLVEWHGQAADRAAPPPSPAVPAPHVEPTPPPAGLTLAELCLLWIAACEKRFTRKDGTTTSSIHGANTVVRALERDGAMPASSFRARSSMSPPQFLYQ